MHTKANCAWIDASLVEEVAAPHAATMYCDTPIPIAPVNSTVRRPSLSIATSPGNVEMTLTTLVMTVRMNGSGSAPWFWLLK